MSKILTKENLNKTAKEIIKELKNKKKESATIIAFFGDLGVGKTTTTKEIAKELGIKKTIVSPTFVVMKSYQTKDTRFKKLVHIDAYRLEKEEDVLILGWKEIIEDKNNLVVVEWTENILKYLPSGVYNIKIEHKDETTRTIKFWYN